MIDIYIQIGSLVGGAVGWQHSRSASGYTLGAYASFPVALALLALGWYGYARWSDGFDTFGGAALGYGLAFVLRRIFYEPTGAVLGAGQGSPGPDGL